MVLGSCVRLLWLIWLLPAARAGRGDVWCREKDTVTYHDPPNANGETLTVSLPRDCRKLAFSRLSSKFGDAGVKALALQLREPFDNATGKSRGSWSRAR